MLIYSLIYKRSKLKNKFLRKLISALLLPYLFVKNSYIGLAKFSSIPIFPHGINGIFISSGAKIGKNCTIFHQVTIGSNTIQNSKNIGAPTIGDNVYIGCGAKIIGGVIIGNNVRIGANAVVCVDIPDNTTVVNQACRIILKKEKQINVFTGFDQAIHSKIKS